MDAAGMRGHCCSLLIGLDAMAVDGPFRPFSTASCWSTNLHCRSGNSRVREDSRRPFSASGSWWSARYLQLIHASDNLGGLERWYCVGSVSVFCLWCWWARWRDGMAGKMTGLLYSGLGVEPSDFSLLVLLSATATRKSDGHRDP